MLDTHILGRMSFEGKLWLRITEVENCKALASSKLRLLVYSSRVIAFGLTFALRIQYSIFCSTFMLLYDEVRRQPRFEYIP